MINPAVARHNGNLLELAGVGEASTFSATVLCLKGKIFRHAYAASEQESTVYNIKPLLTVYHTPKNAVK